MKYLKKKCKWEFFVTSTEMIFFFTSGPQPVRLCPKKFNCDVYNATNLFELQGNASMFGAEEIFKNPLDLRIFTRNTEQMSKYVNF